MQPEDIEGDTQFTAMALHCASGMGDSRRQR